MPFNLNFLICQYNGGLIHEIRINGLARNSITIHLRSEYSALNPLCSHYDSVVLQSKTNASSFINQHSDDDLGNHLCYEN